MILKTKCMAFFLAIFFLSCGNNSKKENADKPAMPPVAKVDGFIVSPQLLSQDIEVPGSLAASQEVELHPEVAGRVTGV